MQIPEFDVTITVGRNDAYAVAHTDKGTDFMDRLVWETPQEFLDQIPPGLRLGVRTKPRNKFTLFPPRSLH